MRTREIMIVEDNRGDVLLFQEALQQLGKEPRLTVARDGVAALELLRNRAELSPPQLPDLVLLDLNLPRMGGQEVLRHLHADPVLGALAIMILTSSKVDRHLLETFGIPADRYLVKPAGFQGFLELAARIARFLECE